MKTYSTINLLGAVWDYYCLQRDVPVGIQFMTEVQTYERDVLTER